MYAAGSSYPLARRPASLDAVAAFDDICLERDGARPAVQLQEESAGVAEDGTRFIATPERCGACRAVPADGLDMVSDLFLMDG